MLLTITLMRIISELQVNSPVAGVPELRPDTLSAELGTEDGAFTPPSGGGGSAPLHPQGQTPPQGGGASPWRERKKQ